ncbi:MAG: proline dehydrogenase family protein, partial [Myxococcota bacterium]
MTRPDFKVEMFRFVDVLPVLNTSTEVARHIQEYFCRPDQDFPKALQWGLKSLAPGSMVARLAAGQIERNVIGMARTFIAGEDARAALPRLKTMWTKQQLAFTVDLLGESTVSEAEAATYQQRYLQLIEQLAAEAARWPERPALETDAFGPMPRVNVSIKLSALYPLLDTAATESIVPELKRRLRPLFKRATELGVFINLDMEHYDLKPLTLTLFKEMLAEPDFEELMAGCVIQAYLRDAEDDLHDLIQWARAHQRSVTVRLVKGAYWDYESIHAEQHGWPVPVWTDKGATDAHYERLSRLMLENIDVIRPAFGSHNVRSLAYAIATAQALGLPDNAYEIQMLYGMADPLKGAMRKMGLRLRDYVPVGELIPGMAYLVRRLLENTSNESWLRARFADGANTDTLLAAPRPAGGPQRSFTGYPAEGRPHAQPEEPFVGEAVADFSKLSLRDAMRRALKVVEKDMGRRWPLVIGDEERWTDRVIDSVDPAAPDRIVAQVAVASPSDIDDALRAARAAFPGWRDTPVRERAQLLIRAAAQMRERRFNLAALMVYEAGKQWREADADVCEAIDFLEYYARQAIALQDKPQPMGQLPGEDNHLLYEPRGMAAIIAPWNFPLAILVGMSSAALVTGNCVLLKPAEQTPAIAAAWMAILRKAGLPPGVANFVPGYGEEVGAYLVEHPHVDLIAFTGSMNVGLSIIRQAAWVRPGQRNIKKVIA